MSTNKNKKIIILQHNGGRLANQLWQYISIYAYCLEKGYSCANWSFFQYRSFFPGIVKKNRTIDFLFSPFFKIVPTSDKENSYRNKWHHNDSRLSNNIRFLFLMIYAIFVYFIRFFYKNRIQSENSSITYLPPTSTCKQLDMLVDRHNTIYFDGWLFRNPVGIKKHANKIREVFQPLSMVKVEINTFISNLRDRYDFIVGVLIRQCDWKYFAGGKYYFTQYEVKIIIDDFLKYQIKHNSLSHDKTVFVICSDGDIDAEIFKDINYVVETGGIKNLFTLAKTDFILCNNSSFAPFSSYLGNIKAVLFDKNIDWNNIDIRSKYEEDPRWIINNF